MISTKFRFQDEINRTRKWYEAKEKRALFAGGNYGRKVARSSLRVRRRSKKTGLPLYSKPGAPPKISWPKSPLKYLMSFGVDVHRGSVVVGPLLFKPAWKSPRPEPGETVPSILENGGEVITRRGEIVKIAPRPYLKPVLRPATDVILEKMKA